MSGRIPRRQRLLLITGGLGLLFLVGVGGFVFQVLRPPAEYLPGETIEGISTELRRTLPKDVPPVTLTDATAAAGISFRHFSGVRSTQLPEDMGSGAAWGDYDRDGWIDLFVANEAGPLTMSAAEVARSPAHCALYHNEGDGTFTEVSAAAGVDHRGLGMGAAWGDYDNDGWPDLVLTNYGRNVLYRNRGDGTFEDVTTHAGMDVEPGFWTGASWADYDRDGLLDLYITGYVRYAEGAATRTGSQYDVQVPSQLNPSAFPAERNLLYHNQGDGTFAEVSERAGVSGATGRSLSASWADFDGDGWPDLYVANDLSDNLLFRNRGDGTFEDVSYAARVADYRGAMGLAVGDWNGDSDLDLFVAHWIAQENALYDNRTSGAGGALSRLKFMDQADRVGLGQVALDFVGWGTSFIDYDNDGRLDLYVANGSTVQREDDPHQLLGMHDLLFWNRGPEEGFYDVSSVAGKPFKDTLVSRGAAFGDYDNDGDVDVFVVSNDGPGKLLRNDGGNASPWLEVALEGVRSVRSAVGSTLWLFARGGSQVRQVGSQSSYLSQNSPVQHFGLGDEGSVDSLVIEWPRGLRQVIRDVPLNRKIHVREGEPAASATAPVAASATASPAASAATGRNSAGERAGRPDRQNDQRTDRQRILRFWEVYRQATRARVAGRPADAARIYKQALELKPTHEDALYYLGNADFEIGDLAGAEGAWERLTRVNPASTRAYVRLGTLHSCVPEISDAGHFDPARAEAEFRHAHAINGEETGPLLQLGMVALLGNRLGDAERDFADVLGSNPRSAPARYLSGYVAWRRGQQRAALEAFREAIHLARTMRSGPLVPPRGPQRSGAEPCRTLRSMVSHLADQAGRSDLPDSARQAGRFELADSSDRAGASADLRSAMRTRYRNLENFFRSARSAERPLSP